MRNCKHCDFPHHFVGDGSFQCDNCGQHNKPQKTYKDHPSLCNDGVVTKPLPGLDEIENPTENSNDPR